MHPGNVAATGAKNHQRLKEKARDPIASAPLVSDRWQSITGNAISSKVSISSHSKASRGHIPMRGRKPLLKESCRDYI
jgi:hypothetical protein